LNGFEAMDYNREDLLEFMEEKYINKLKYSLGEGQVGARVRKFMVWYRDICRLTMEKVLAENRNFDSFV